MSRKDRVGLISTIGYVLLTYFNKVNALIRSLRADTELAGKTLIFLLILCFLIALFCTTCWFSLLALLFIYLTDVQWTALQAMAFITLINVILVLVAVIIGMKIKRNLLFPKTRKNLRALGLHSTHNE